MPKISQYPLKALAVGDYFVTMNGGKNYQAPFENAIPRGYIFGLIMDNGVTDPVNDIDISAGECKSTDNAVVLSLSADLRKRLDATFVAGTNQGMRSSSVALADATYHIFAMRAGGVDDVGADTSPTGANLVIDHSATNLRRIGSIVRTGGAIKSFVQDGDKFMWITPVNDVSAVNPGTAAVTRTLTVPTGVRVEALISVAGTAAAAADMPGGILISDLSLDDVAPAVNLAFSVEIFSTSAINLTLGAIDRVFTNTSAQVRSRVQISTANTTLRINTHGWVDTRGRLS
jgi:hypothetical protein